MRNPIAADGLLLLLEHPFGDPLASVLVRLRASRHAVRSGRVSRGLVVTREGFADLWPRLAPRCWDNDHGLFNLMNVPHRIRADLVVENQNAAIAAICPAGADNLILVSAKQYLKAFSLQRHMDDAA
jgi:hypothetical protein